MTTDSPSAPRKNTARHALGGMVWSGVGFGAQGIGQFLVVIVFARYLTRADNDIVGAAVIIIALGQLFTDSGFAAAVVQREDLTDEHIRTAFALSLLTGAVMTTVTYLLAPVAGAFFHSPGLPPIVRGLSFVFILQAPGLIAEALLQRDLDFRSIAIAETVSYFFGFAGVGVILVLAGVGVWAIAIAQLAQAALLTGIFLIRRHHPKSLRPHKREAIDLVVYAGGMTAARGFNFVALYGDNTVVGNQMGKGALGAYKNAYQLAVVPAQLLGQVMDRVIFPVISRFQSDLRRVAGAYLRGVALVSMLTIPGSVLAVLLGPEIIHLLLGGGSKWDDVIVPFQIFSAGLLFRTSYKISDSLARAMGTVYQRALRQAVYAVAVVVGAFIGSQYGLSWVALGVTGAIILNYLLMAQLSLRTAPIGWGHFFFRQGRGLVLAAVTAAAAVPAVLALRGADAGNLATIVGGTLAALAALGICYLVRPSFVLGRDGQWLMDVVRGKRGTEDPDYVEVSA